ncbi:Putative arsenite methyltransferase [uncultured archaeon]|nr:Putative arsenite methyltransferase [uncultured archaeon]
MEDDSAKLWNHRFKQEGAVWGIEPSPAAVKAAELFKKKKACGILEVGCAYGRDVEYFRREGFEAVGIDASEEALRLGKKLFPKADLRLGSLLNLPFKDASYDAVYGFFIFHIFTSTERKKAFDEMMRVLKPGGLLVHSVPSEKDEKFGPKGTRGSEGKYFTKKEIREMLAGMTEVEITEDLVNHTHGGTHIHADIYFTAQKPN